MLLIEDSIAHRALVRSKIILLGNISTFCVIYTLYSLRYGLTVWRHPSALRIWCALETVFYAFMYWYRGHLQGDAKHPPLRSREERRALVHKVQDESHSHEKFLSGWFRGAKLEEIGRDGLKQFLDWAFWDGRSTAADEEEMNEYISEYESLTGVHFKEGKGTARCVRLTLDPIEMDSRSLVWYGLIMLADTIAGLILLWTNWQHHRYSFTRNFVFPPRPATLLASAKSPAKNISYWIKPHNSTTRVPVLYLHGIGVGLLPQVEFLNELDHSLNDNAGPDDQVGILALETLAISSRITSAILTRQEFLTQIIQVLDANGYDRFVLCAHSYGSVLSTHVLYHEDLSSRISATLLIDPVSIMLHMPDVAYNFMARPPTRANEWQLWYFGSHDPGVAHTLTRHFFWNENTLWRDRVLELVKNGMKFTAGLASDDLIVDTLSVGRYLTAGEVGDPVIEKGGDGQMKQSYEQHKPDTWKYRPWKTDGLNIVWWEKFDHAHCFQNRETRGQLVDILTKYSKAG
ncbi:hypothetical protein K431DRAFT_289453 [Polychaeton citri CBS 116435]|uniref:AB hydrolase-1 domain-containing protein n=1 Tax=Polychaeton citri CBS 116435 TaxID=1314669 RepID=A0A9P4UI24_9PEZI|nr:hypothetical protein K431DRAFT_289453 [Polychaeton citri CBS 116435]